MMYISIVLLNNQRHNQIKKQGSFANEIRIYYGETLDDEGNPITFISEEEDGKVVEKEIENIFVSSPAIYNNDKFLE